MTHKKLVGIGENGTVFGWPVKHLMMADYSCRLCKAPVLTKHAVTIFSPTATKATMTVFENLIPAQCSSTVKQCSTSTHLSYEHF